MIRLFAALSLPAEIADALTQRQHGLLGARWRPLDSLHITLRFFGEVAEDVAVDLDGELARIDAPAFELALQGAGHFGEGKAIDAVWAGVAANPSLDQLAHACERAARRCGLAPETRRYHPHVTLAYLRRPDPLAVAGWIQANNLLHSPSFLAPRFALYSSWLGREGSRYTIERSYPLAERAPRR